MFFLASLVLMILSGISWRVDMLYLKDLVLDNFTNRPAVTRVETSIIYEARVRHELPQLQEPHASVLILNEIIA